MNDMDIFYDSEIEPESFNTVIVNVETMKHFILHTKDKDYVLDFQKLLEDYGVEAEQR